MLITKTSCNNFIVTLIDYKVRFWDEMKMAANLDYQDLPKIGFTWQKNDKKSLY